MAPWIFWAIREWLQDVASVIVFGALLGAGWYYLQERRRARKRRRELLFAEYDLRRWQR